MQINPRFVLALCNAGMGCVALGASLIPVYLTTFADAFGGLGADELGRVAGLLFLGFVTGILTTGPLADRFGAKPFVLLGTAASVAGLLLLASTWSYSSLLVAGFVIGLGAGIIDMVMSPIVSALAIENRTVALNRLHAFYCLGAISTLAIASAMLRLGAPWRVVVGSFALVPAVVFLGFLVAAVPPLVHPDEERQGLRQLAFQPRFHLAVLAITLVGATEEGMAQWLPAYAEQALGFSKSTAAMGLAGFAISMGVGRWIASHVGARWTSRQLILAGALWCGAGFLVGGFAPVPAIAFAGCILVGFGCSVLWPTCLAMAADAFPQGGATLFAALAAAGNAGCLAAPLLCGYVAEYGGLRTALGLGAVYPLLIAAGIGARQFQQTPTGNAS
jgi:fucose permease